MIKKIIVLLGLPGSGKGTQGAVLSSELRIPHISTGDIFRAMANQRTEESYKLSEYMHQGKLIPSELVNKVVKKFIFSDECKNGCILDGYPRNLEQAEYFIENISTDVTIIFFEITAETALKRILGRFACSDCNAVYNKFYNKPKNDKCTVCGSAKFNFREDDDEITFRSRINEYIKETLPVVDYYKKRSNFFTINAENEAESISEEVLAIAKMV